MSEMLDCADVAELLGETVKRGYLPQTCCSSCHEDASEFGYDLLNVALKDGRSAYVCCWQNNALLRAGLTYE